MAIKVNNTTVIDDSRNITNIATATATSFVGDGSGLTNLPVSDGGTITATASGSLSNGAPVVVNSNGTVSAVSGTGNEAVLSSSAYISGSFLKNLQGSWDNNRNRYLAIYQDSNGYIRGSVGTVSGNSISFGSSVVISSSSNIEMSPKHALAYNINCDIFVVAYGIRYGTGRWKTIEIESNGSLSVGSEYAEPNTNTDRNTDDAWSSNTIAAMDDWSYAGSNTCWFANIYSQRGSTSLWARGLKYENGNLILSTSHSNPYELADDATSYLSGRDLACCCLLERVHGTQANINEFAYVYLSDTSTIKYGYFSVYQESIGGYASNTYTLHNGSGNRFQIFNVEHQSGDPHTYKYLVSAGYVANISSYNAMAFIYNYGYNSTASTFTEVTSEMALGQGSFDVHDNKIVAVGEVNLNSSSYTNKMKIIEASISGSAITVESTMHTSFDSGFYADVTYNPNDDNYIISSFNDASNASVGNIYVPDSLVSNLTDSNFIGFSDASYSNGQTATIQIIGSVDDAQSGLTPGLEYYTQRDGTLDSVPDIPSVKAGVALASNKILVKK